jgi:SAM-dependent methyltransferase
MHRMYSDLSSWWTLISHPDHYVEEAGIYARAILSFFPEQAARAERLKMLELGSGGGNNASHLKKIFDNTLVDLSPDMLAVSRQFNPELPHHQGDMRTVRLDQQFDVVFVHDAVCYLLSEDDLRQLMRTARAHLRPGGVVLICPDFTCETFRPTATVHGGDEDGRALRYLEWTYDPDPSDNTAVTDFAYLLREGADDVRCLNERHLFGLFSREDWLRLLSEEGFTPHALPFDHSEVEGVTEMFAGVLKSAGY